LFVVFPAKRIALAEALRAPCPIDEKIPLLFSSETVDEEAFELL
jgi:hypothetical protein